MATELVLDGVTVTLYRSAGADEAVVVQIDTADDLTTFGSLRVNVNDGRVWGPPYEPVTNG